MTNFVWATENVHKHSYLSFINDEKGFIPCITFIDMSRKYMRFFNNRLMRSVYKDRNLLNVIFPDVMIDSILFQC